MEVVLVAKTIEVVFIVTELDVETVVATVVVLVADKVDDCP